MVSTLGLLGLVWLGPVQSGLLQFILGQSGTTQQPLVSTSYSCLLIQMRVVPTGCLRWSPMGGEVTYMCHTSKGGCEPSMVVPMLCLDVLDGSRIARCLQVFQIGQ